MQVLKIAIIAEKYATDYSWYVDTILELIRIGGDFVGEEVRRNCFIYVEDLQCRKYVNLLLYVARDFDGKLFACYFREK